MKKLARADFVFALILSTISVGQAASDSEAKCHWPAIAKGLRCPFCTAVQQTITEQIGTSDVVVLAELLRLPDAPPKDDQLPKGTFRVVEILKGQPDTIAVGHEFASIVIGQPEIGQTFLLMGVDPPELAWTTPLKMSPAAIDYLRALPGLPAKGMERLKFFQEFFEHPESMLAFDAYEEFARASYAEVIELKPFMHRDRLLKWIQDPEVSTSRKRLYFTLLGVCGTAEDLPLLETLITSGENEKRRGLDALVACYLTLKGEDGLALIERQFFENQNSEYVDTFAAISAIRFLATEKKDIPRERILTALHKVLDRPTLADLVIPDLARWEDWSVIDKMVELFKNATEESKWVRVPVVSYLQVCPKPEAKVAIEELKKIDPESVRRAETLLRWESGEDEFEESEEDADSDAADEPADESAPATKDGEPADKDGDAINVPVYEVKRLPSLVGEFTAFDRIPEATLGDDYVSTAKSLSPSTRSGSTAEQSESSEALVAAAPTVSSTLAIIFVPLGTFVVLLLLSWSVLNGWFERLIF